jgi:hypothetical protein
VGLLVAPIASSADTAMTVLFAGVLVLGYVALWLIWRLFFRGRGDEPPDTVDHDPS